MINENIKEKYKQHANDTGSIEVQIISITQEINKLVDHFKTHKKDHSSKRGLSKLVNRRRNFLNYIKSNNQEMYKKLIEDLELRK
jgi:small subunit ribosomal protein S15